MITAKEIAKQATKNQKRIEKEAAAKREADRTLAEARYKKEVAFSTKELQKLVEKSIFEAVAKGEFSTSVHYGNTKEAYENVEKILLESGYEASIKSEWCREEMGDSDNGYYGARSAGWEYELKISWKKE